MPDDWTSVDVLIQTGPRKYFILRILQGEGGIPHTIWDGDLDGALKKLIPVSQCYIDKQRNLKEIQRHERKCV